jgi:hypothetical protein
MTFECKHNYGKRCQIIHTTNGYFYSRQWQYGIKSEFIGKTQRNVRRYMERKGIELINKKENLDMAMR